MASLTFPVKTAFTLSWVLKASDGTFINNATMTANLYAGRSMRNPDGIPGTLVPPINAFDMPYVAASQGLYAATVPGTLDPPLDGVGYILVIDATVSGAPVYHSETPVAVDVAGSTLDLTTLDAVKGRGEVSGTKNDAEIQSAITGFSKYLLKWSGQASLNSIVSLDEFYNGNGNNQMFLRSWPVLSLISVVMNGIAVPSSGGVGAWGVTIDQGKQSIILRGGVGNFSTFPYPNSSLTRRGPVFIRGMQNIEVQYTAGYPDVPPDLEYAVRCVVALNYKRKGWQDQGSRTVSSGQGNAITTYRSWEWPPEYQQIFENYQRKALI